MNQDNLFNPTTLDRVLGVSGIIAPLILLFAILIAGLLYPGYSHLTQPISALGAKEATSRHVLNFGGLIPVGTLTFIFAIGMFRSFRNGKVLRISAVLVAVAGLGRLSAGIFPCDPGCLQFVTVTARLHAVAGITSLSAGAIAPLVMAFGTRSRQPRGYFYLSLGLGLATLIILATALLQLWTPYNGLAQRLLLIFTYAWIIAIAVGICWQRGKHDL